jgi:hypothetical protein
MVRKFETQQIYHHTYQLEEDRAFRTATHYLQHSTNIEDIKQELAELGLPSLVVGLAARSVFTWLHRFSDSTTSLLYGNGYQVRKFTWLVYGGQQLWVQMRK